MSTDIQHDEVWIQDALSCYEITDDDYESEIEGQVIAHLMRSYAKHMYAAAYEAGQMAGMREITQMEATLVADDVAPCYEASGYWFVWCCKSNNQITDGHGIDSYIEWVESNSKPQEAGA